MSKGNTRKQALRREIGKAAEVTVMVHAVEMQVPITKRTAYELVADFHEVLTAYVWANGTCLLDKAETDWCGEIEIAEPVVYYS